MKSLSLIRKLLESSASEEWWGIDFDGTLATYDDWKGPGHVGEPIQKSIEFVKGLLKDGKKVKIFTARVANPDEEDEAREAIRKFCKEHLGRAFPITNEKDPHMIGLLDDKLDMKRVKQNTGELVESEKFIRGAWIDQSGKVLYMPAGLEHGEWLDLNVPYQRINGVSNHSKMMRVVKSFGKPDMLYGNLADESIPNNRQMKALKDLGIELGIKTFLFAKEVFKGGRLVHDPESYT